MQTFSEPRRIGAYLSCPTDAIEWAVAVQAAELASGGVKPIGEILLEREQITREQLKDALARQRIDRLRQCALFADMSDCELARIGEIADEVNLAAGQELLRQDQRGDSLYTVVSGRVLIFRRCEHLEGVPVGVALPGEFLGEMDYFSDGTRSFSATAIEPTLLLKIRYEFLPDRAQLTRDLASGYDHGFSAKPATELPPGDHSGSADPSEEINARTDALIDNIVRRACRVLQADSAGLFLIEPESGDLLSKVTKGGLSRNIRVRAGTEITGWVAQTGELANVPEAYLDSRFNPGVDIWADYWTRTVLAGPVRNPEGQIIGVIQAVNKTRDRRFTREDEVLLRAFTCQSADAVASCWKAKNKRV